MLVAAAVLAATMTPGCASISADDDPIVLGYLGGLSGKSSGLGLAGRDGAVLAVEQINAAGGIDGRRVVLELADDGAGVGASEAGMRELARKGALAVIGPVTSVSAVEAVPVANELGVPLISPTVTSTDFTAKDDSFLRTCSDNALYGSRLAEQARERFGVQQVGCIVDDGNASYSRTVAKHFEDAFVSIGGQSVGMEGFVSGGDVDFSEVVSKLLARKPDSVFVVGNPLDSGMICQRLRGADFDGRILLAHWSVSSSADLLKAGGKAVDGAFFLDNYDRASEDERFVEWVAAFESRFSYQPGYAAMHAYDAARLAAHVAAERHGDEPMKEALLGAGPWKGLQDTFEFDRNGDTLRPTYPMTIEDGEFVPAGTQ